MTVELAAPVLSIEEAANYLRIEGKALVSMARAKKIGSLKIGRTLTFPRGVLDDYVATHTVKAEDNPWGLTDAAVKSIQDGRPARTKKK